MYEFLSKKKLKGFLKIFGIDFKKIDESIRRHRFYRSGIGMDMNKFLSDAGICKNCENFSEHLKPEDLTEWFVRYAGHKNYVRFGQYIQKLMIEISSLS